jgi:hypothetical protein
MLDEEAKKIALAIRKVESNGNYNAKGASGESGAYQFMPKTWAGWAQKYLGNSNAQLSPENQNKVAYSKVKELKDQGMTPEQIALVWNGGQPVRKAGVNKFGVKYDSGAYADKVLKAYGGGNFSKGTSSAVLAGETATPATTPTVIDQKGLKPGTKSPNATGKTFAGTQLPQFGNETALPKPVTPQVTLPTQQTSDHSDINNKIDQARTQGQTDTDILNNLETYNADLGPKVTSARKLYGKNGSSISNDRDLLNYISTTYAGVMPKVPSVAPSFGGTAATKGKISPVGGNAFSQAISPEIKTRNASSVVGNFTPPAPTSYPIDTGQVLGNIGQAIQNIPATGAVELNKLAGAGEYMLQKLTGTDTSQGQTGYKIAEDIQKNVLDKSQTTIPFQGQQMNSSDYWKLAAANAIPSAINAVSGLVQGTLMPGTSISSVGGAVNEAQLAQQEKINVAKALLSPETLNAAYQVTIPQALQGLAELTKAVATGKDSSAAYDKMVSNFAESPAEQALYSYFAVEGAAKGSIHLKELSQALQEAHPELLPRGPVDINQQLNKTKREVAWTQWDKLLGRQGLI